MDTNKEQFGKIATTPEEMALNRSNLQDSLSKIAKSNISTNNTSPDVITSDLLSVKDSPIKLPEIKNSVSSGIIGSIAAKNEKLQKDLDAERIAAENAKRESKSELQSILNEAVGIQNSRIGEEEKAGIPKFREDLNNITNEIDSVQRAYQNEIKALESSNMTDIGKAAASRDISRKYASELADLSIIQNARNRNLLTAQSNVDRKIELLLEPIRQKLDYQKSVYEENKDSFTKADERRYQNIIKNTERELNKEEERVKTLENTKLRYMDIASSLGKDNTVLTAIVKSTSPEEVLSIASKNGVISLDDQLKSVQLKEKKLEYDKLKKEATEELGGNTQKADDLTAYSQQFADTGKLPSPTELKQSGLNVGQVTMFAKQMSKPDGSLVSTNTGVKTSTLSPAQEEGIIALSEIVRDTLPSLQKKYPKLWNGIIGGTAGLVFTSQDRQDYQTFRQEFLNKLLKARSGATVTPQEYDRYAALLPGEFSINPLTESQGNKKLISLATAMKQTLDNALKSNQLSIYGYSTVDVGGTPRKVGEVLDMNGTKLRVLPDGTLTDNI